MTVINFVQTKIRKTALIQHTFPIFTETGRNVFRENQTNIQRLVPRNQYLQLFFQINEMYFVAYKLNVHNVCSVSRNLFF